MRSGTYLPTKFSRTELLPALWPPTTAICGKSSCICTPSCVNASCSLFTIGINCSIPALPAIPSDCRDYAARKSTHDLARSRTLCLSVTTDACVRDFAVVRDSPPLLLLLVDALPPPAHARPLKGWPTEASPSVAESKHALKQDGRFPSAKRTARSRARWLTAGSLVVSRGSLHRIFIPRR